MTHTLLTLICSPSIEQTINDWLLEQHDMPGFTSMSVFGHGSQPETLTLVEQVQGRKKQIMFQIHMSSERADKAIEELKQRFKGARIHYWLTPVITSGNLNTDSSE